MSSSKIAEVSDKACGLVVLMGGDGHKQYYPSADDFEGTVHHAVHPFGLSLPPDPFLGSRRFAFVGAHATDRSVEAFCATLRSWMGHVEEQRVTKLRVISTKFPGGQPGQHHVFFEVWLGDLAAFMSGETTDFSGAGNTARQKLQAVFDLLAVVYGVQIETHSFDRETDLSALYNGTE